MLKEEKEISMPNKSFSEMTQPEKAVAVAKDILKHLKSIRVKSENTYLEMKKPLSDRIDNDDNAQRHIDAITKNCEVCAVGACFLSYVRVFNQVTVGDVLKAGYSYMQNKIRDAFPQSMLLEIEDVFEEHQFTSVHLKRQYKDAKQRLRAIMLNIVQNKGKFLTEV